MRSIDIFREQKSHFQQDTYSAAMMKLKQESPYRGHRDSIWYPCGGCIRHLHLASCDCALLEQYTMRIAFRAAKTVLSTLWVTVSQRFVSCGRCSYTVLMPLPMLIVSSTPKSPSHQRYSADPSHNDRIVLKQIIHLTAPSASW
jgi:hypothetical protein